MMNYLKTRLGKTSLQTVLSVPFVLLLFFVVMIISFLLYTSGQNSVEMAANQLIIEITRRIEQNLQSYMATPPLITQINANALKNNQLNRLALSSWRNHLFTQSQLFEDITYIYYGDEQGQYVEWQRYTDGVLEYSIKDTNTNGLVEAYLTDSFGKLTELIRIDEFEPRERPWYQQAAETNQPSWTAIYEFSDNPTLGISFTRPVYDDEERFIGVLGADFTLLQINQFLQQLQVGQTGRAFIVEPSGALVASSADAPPLSIDNHRLLAINATDTLIQRTAQQLADAQGTFRQVEDSQLLRFASDGGQNLVKVCHFGDAFGLDWIIVIVVPEADFMTQIWQGRRLTIGISLFVLFLATAGGMLTARWVVNPIMKLNEAARQLAGGGALRQAVVIERDDEVGQLAQSFNRMADQLSLSFKTLEESEKKYRTLFEDSMDVIFITNSVGRILDINPAGLALFGYERADFLALSVRHFYVNVEDGKRLVKQIVRDGAVTDFEVQLLKRGGAVMDCLLTATARYTEEGEATSVYQGIIRDVTARKQTERELAQHRNDLEKMVSARTAELTAANKQLQTEIQERQQAEIASMEANAKLQNRVEELSTLNQITKAVTMTVDLQTVLDTVAREIVGIFGAYSSGIALFNIDRTELRVVADFIQDKTVDSAVGVFIPIDNNPSTQTILQTKKPLIIPDAQTNRLTEVVHEVMRAQNIHSLIIAPLLARGEVIGSFSVNTSDVARQFTQTEVKLIETIGGQVAGVVENARLFEQEKQQRQVAESLREVAVTLNRSLDQQTVINRILNELRQVIDYNSVSLFLRDDEGLLLAAGVGLNNGEIGYRADDNSDHLAAQVYRSQKPLIIQNVQDNEFWKADLSDPRIRGWMAAPMFVGKQTVGVLCIDSFAENYYEPNDSQTLQLFANQAATAVRNSQLYEEIQQKNDDLAQTLQELKVTQNELIQSEKMAALGQLVAGVAHEINTPLGVIRAAIGNITETQTQTVRAMPPILHSLSEPERALFVGLLERATAAKVNLSSKEERKLRRKLRRELEGYQLDQAHLYADMLTDVGVYDDLEPFLPLFQKADGLVVMEMIYMLARQQTNSQNIKIAVERASKIVFALKRYSRFDYTDSKVMTNVQETLDTVLTLYQNKIKLGVEVSCYYEKGTPDIPCYADELNQVWTNIIHNALQAMNNQGRLDILLDCQTVENQNWVRVSITDNGPGMTDEVKAKIFQPFFTTKPAGEGSGLGLDISRKIIDKHAGKIEVESQPGRTTFTVWLPFGAATDADECPVSEPESC